MKIRDLVNFDMLFPNMQRKIYLRDLVFEIFTIEFRPFFDKFLKYGQAIIVSDWLISKKSSPLKPRGQMNRNLVGSIYGKTSIKIAHFVPIR
jgi:hypothetical protein